MISRLFKCTIIIFLLCGLTRHMEIRAQNLLHYAISTNGERGKCLFPEDATGNVVFSSIIDVPCSADSIIMVADEYISSQNITEKCKVKKIASSSRSCTYSIQLNIGQQSWGIEFWGSPLFVFQRDASHVKFKCIVEARNGKYKYSLIDFETNRNSLRGEAKNDGQPNIIHWQRVNSLTKERNAYAAKHDITKRNVKEEIFDYNSQIAYEACLYQAEYDATLKFEYGLKNLQFGDDFMDFATVPSITNAENENQGTEFISSQFGKDFFMQTGGNDNFSRKEPTNKFINDGHIFDKGHNVFITSGDRLFELSGAQELVKQTMIDGFWNVVDDIKLAHFVMRYEVTLEGRDKAYLYFSTPNSNNEVKISSTGGSESIIDNREIARRLYLNSVFPMYKKIEEKNYPKQFSVFGIKKTKQ